MHISTTLESVAKWILMHWQGPLDILSASIHDIRSLHAPWPVSHLGQVHMARQDKMIKIT